MEIDINLKNKLAYYYINGVETYRGEFMNLEVGDIVPLCSIKHKVTRIENDRIFVEPLQIQTENEGIINLVSACEELLKEHYHANEFVRSHCYYCRKLRKAVDNLKDTLHVNS